MAHTARAAKEKAAAEISVGKRDRECNVYCTRSGLVVATGQEGKEQFLGPAVMEGIGCADVQVSNVMSSGKLKLRREDHDALPT
jgi:hypothetical protein